MIPLGEDEGVGSWSRVFFLVHASGLPRGYRGHEWHTTSESS